MVIWLLVTWQVSTLRHELCHARYALEPTYRDAVRSAWAQWQPSLKRWIEIMIESLSHAIDQ